MNNHSTNGYLVPRRSHVFPSAHDGEPGRVKQEPDLTASASQAHLDGGLAMYMKGQTHEALWDFFQSIGSDSRNPLAHYLCGLALKALGLGAEAEVEWETVLMLTSVDGVPPSLETDWVRSMAQRLLGTV